MFDRVYIEYDDIVKHYLSVIKYLTDSSDFFTVTPIINKPYSQMPPLFKYSNELQPFATQYLFNKSDWLIDFITPRKHQIMVAYDCCKNSCKELLKIPNIFLPDECGAPEDICFYRSGKLLFATISHERICFGVGLTDKDIDFFKGNNILVYDSAV